MDDVVSRFFSELLGRWDGPLSFRFILQPLMATWYAYRDGVKDAHAGRTPYFWSIFTNPEGRGELLHDGFRSVGRVIALGVAMELVYAVFVLRGFRPLELIVVVLLLAFVPYLLLRGPFNRLARRRIHVPSGR